MSDPSTQEPASTSSGRWRYASASVRGTSHVGTNQPCQDAGQVQTILREDGAEWLVAIVADGAGSAAHSEIGSGIAVDRAFEWIADHARYRDDLDDDERLWPSLVDAIRMSIETRAIEDGQDVREYACTLLIAVVMPAACRVMQVGDGAIVFRVASEQTFQLALPPERGEYANTTAFVTMPAPGASLRWRRIDGLVADLAVFSDGIQHLVLHTATNLPHGRFFESMLRPLSAADGSGHLVSLSASLEKYLDSPDLNKRTDDDKTLILASRATRQA